MQTLAFYIVEPDRTAEDGLVSLARSLDLEPIYLPSPTHAIKQIEQDCRDKARPFLLLVQAEMPTMSGAMLLSTLASGPAAGVPHRTILLAGRTSFNTLRSAIQTGVNDILPIAPDARLLRQSLLTNRQALQAQFDRQSQVNDLLSSLRHHVATSEQAHGIASHEAPLSEEALSSHHGDYGDVLHLLDRPAKRPAGAVVLDQHDQLAVIRVLQFVRRARDRAVPVCADGDPSWDILLFVQEQALLGNRVSVTAACHASTIPQTTAMRKVDELVAAGLLTRDADPADRRRINLAPTELGAAQITGFLQDALVQIRALFQMAGHNAAHDPLREAAE